MTIPQPAALIGVLQDKTARIDERDDAAMDLAEYDEPEALAALVETAMDPTEHDSVVYSAGASIAAIWERSKVLDFDLLRTLRPEAQSETRGLFRLD